MLKLSKHTQLSWGKFLSTEAGKDGIAYLRERTPTIIKAPNPHEMVFDSGKAAGWTSCVEEFLKMIEKDFEKNIDAENR